MTNARDLVLAGFLTLAVASIAGAQSPTIQPLGWLDTGVRHSVAKAVSANGTYIVGHSRSSTGYDRAFVWTAVNNMREIGTAGGVPGNSYAESVSNTGMAVGSSPGPYGVVQAAYAAHNRYTVLPAIGGATMDSYAYGISPSGNFIVGTSWCTSGGVPIHAPTRWVLGGSPPSLINGLVSGMAVDVNDANAVALHYASFSASELISVAYTTASGVLQGYGGGQETFVTSIAANPAVAVGIKGGGSFWQACKWDGQYRYPLHASLQVNSYAYDISSDSLVIVGELASGTASRGDAYVWFSSPHSPSFLRDFLVNEYGVDMTGWGRLYAANSVSADGRVIVGSGEYQGATTAFRVFLPLTNRRPTVTTAVSPGTSFNVPLGGTPFSATFAGADLDGDTLTLQATGLPSSAVLTPTAGSTGAPPFNVSLNFIPTLADVGTRNVTIGFADQAYAGKPGSISFSLVVPPNNVPTVSALTAANVECIDGTHLVDLASTVSDADGHPMTVVWKVDGVAKQTTPNVASGTSVAFQYNYPHGQSVVTVEANDSYHTGSASTTVTVTDETDPVVTVAAGMVVPTNPGQSFATGVVLMPPTVSDNCDGDPTLTNNAPAQYPLGLTTVFWTATDADGNQATATQSVAVVDQENPTLAPGAAVKRFVDWGKLTSSAPLVPLAASDNVPAGLVVTSNAPASFPLGLTAVTWTAKDAAGNSSTTTQNVTVVNRKPKANAGKAIVVTTTSENGATVALDGSASSDPDKQLLKYKWAAPGVRLKKPTTAKPSGLFPVGTKTVSLTVTDPAGATSTAKVKVTVKLKNAKARARGKQANDAFAQVFHHGTRDAVNSAPNSQSLTGYAYANAAQRIAIFAGDHVQWNEGQSSADAALDYAQLRGLQSLCGERAASAYLDAYAETGDEDALQAGIWALNGAAYAQADKFAP